MCRARIAPAMVVLFLASLNTTLYPLQTKPGQIRLRATHYGLRHLPYRGQSRIALLSTRKNCEEGLVYSITRASRDVRRGVCWIRREICRLRFYEAASSPEKPTSRIGDNEDTPCNAIRAGIEPRTAACIPRRKRVYRHTFLLVPS